MGSGFGGALLRKCNGNAPTRMHQSGPMGKFILINIYKEYKDVAKPIP
jgi:hypothetical protein